MASEKGRTLAIRATRVVKRIRDDRTQLERKVASVVRQLERTYGVPNSTVTWHAMAAPSPPSSEELLRACSNPLSFGHHTLDAALAKLQPRGHVLEICSPGPDGALGRGMAAQMALREASRGASVLWVSPGPWGSMAAAAAAAAAAVGEADAAQAAGAARRTGAAAGAAAPAGQTGRGHGREQVEQRDQEDGTEPRGIAGHQRTPSGHAACGSGPALWPLQQAQHLECLPWPIRGAGDVQACLDHVLAAVRRQRHSLVVLDGVAGLALRTHTHSQQQQQQQRCHQQQEGAPQQQELARSGTGRSGSAAANLGTRQGLGRGARGAAERGAAMAAARPVDGALDLKFVSNVLPSLLGELLAELRVSTGPGLRTTALILSTYSRTQGANLYGGGGVVQHADAWVGRGTGTCAGGHVGWGPVDTCRWAQRPLQRHALASLHLAPAGPAGGPQQGATVDTWPAAVHAALTRGTASGEDGSVLFTGLLPPPLRLTAARGEGHS